VVPNRFGSLIDTMSSAKPNAITPTAPTSSSPPRRWPPLTIDRLNLVRRHGAQPQRKFRRPGLASRGNLAKRSTTGRRHGPDRPMRDNDPVTVAVPKFGAARSERLIQPDRRRWGPDLLTTIPRLEVWLGRFSAVVTPFGIRGQLSRRSSSAWGC
jgi:hypothetical protein